MNKMNRLGWLLFFISVIFWGTNTGNNSSTDQSISTAVAQSEDIIDPIPLRV